MRAKANFTINKHHNHYKNFVIGAGVFLISFFIAGVLAPVESSDAITCTSGSTEVDGEICSTAGTDVSVTIEKAVYSISVSSSHGSSDTPVSMSYTEDSGNKLGDIVVASDTVTTTTNSPLDHYLYISTNSSSNKLTNEDSIDSNPKTYIAPGGGNTIDSAEALTNDTWGFALPSTTSGIPTNSFDDSYTSDSISSSSKFTKVPVLDNDILVQKEVGTVDEDTGLNTSVADIYYGTKATSSLYAGTYANTIKYTVFTETPKDEPETIEDITYMQDMTGELCSNTKEGTIVSLIDKRGRGNAGTAEDASYSVIRAKDGNCWMRENFDLYNMTGTNAIKAEDSDFESGTYEIPASSNWRSDIYTYALVHASTDTSHIGEVYYNWCAAVAVSSTTSPNCNTTSQVDQSICPKNWALPIYGDENIDKTYGKLLASYNVTSGAELSNSSNPAYALGFRNYGFWYWNGGQYTSESRLFTSTPDPTGYEGNRYSYILAYNNSSLTQKGEHKSNGTILRCVSRD